MNSAPAYATRVGDGNSTLLAFLNKNLVPSVAGTAIGGMLTAAPAIARPTPPGVAVSVFGRGGNGALWMYRGVPGAGTWTSLGGQII